MEQNMNDRSLEELEEHYRELQQRMQEMDFENLTEQDRKDLQELQETKQFYTNTATALAFVVASAGMAEKEKDNIVIRSIMDSEQYGNLLNGLNGRDTIFVELLQSEKVSELTLEERKQETELILKMTEQAEQCPELRTALEQTEKSELTVGDIKETVILAEQIMLEYGIDKEQALQDTDKVLADLYNDDKAHIYEKQEPVTITETNDGYIQNTSRPLTASDTKDVAVKYNVENGNEIHHEIPAETTHDLLQVSPVVHLEEGTVSTLEAEVGITEEMKAVNKNSNDYER